MAAGQNSKTVYNIQVVGGSLMVGDQVREKSEIAIVDGAMGQNDGAAADSVAKSESDRVARYHGKEQNKAVAAPDKNSEDLAWLVEGKIVMYRQRLLNKMNRKVYYGRQQFLPDYWREVAIKLIEYKDKNLRELRILLKLHHPNIVQMIDAGKRRGDMIDYLYIVMELCAQNLRNYVEKNPFNSKISFSFSKQITDGLVFLHENQIVHRDLKPDNILISFDKKTVKLSDFGLSKEIPVGQSAASVTATGAGTEGFRSPETYQSNVRVTPSVDIFPYGLVIHYTFTKGKHPYGKNANEQSYNIMENRNRNLSSVPQFDESNGHKRTQLIDVLDQTLQHNPCDRPTVDKIKNHAFFAADDSAEGIPESLEETKLESERLSRVLNASETRASTSRESEPPKNQKDSEKTKDQTAESADLQSTPNAKRIKEIEDKLNVEKDFRRISQLLNDLRQLRESDDLDILLRVAECEIHLKRRKEDEAIRGVRKFICSSGSPFARDVWELAVKRYEAKSNVQALILYRFSNDLHEKQNVHPNDSVKWIRNLVVNVSLATNLLLLDGGRSRDIGTAYGLEYMKILLDNLRAVNNVDPDIKALNEASCLIRITDAYAHAIEFQKSIRSAQDGIEVLENHFSPEASERKYYGGLLRSMGITHRKYGLWLRKIHWHPDKISEQFSKAKQCLLKALQAQEKALDFETETEKLESIKTTERNLKTVQMIVDQQK